MTMPPNQPAGHAPTPPADEIPSVVFRFDAAAQMVAAISANLNAGGVFVSTGNLHPERTPLRLIFATHADQTVMYLWGEVAAVTRAEDAAAFGRQSGMSVKLLPMSPEDQHRIVTQLQVLQQQVQPQVTVEETIRQLLICARIGEFLGTLGLKPPVTSTQVAQTFENWRRDFNLGPMSQRLQPATRHEFLTLYQRILRFYPTYMEMIRRDEGQRSGPAETPLGVTTTGAGQRGTSGLSLSLDRDGAIGGMASQGPARHHTHVTQDMPAVSTPQNQRLSSPGMPGLSASARQTLSLGQNYHGRQTATTEIRMPGAVDDDEGSGLELMDSFDSLMAVGHESPSSEAAPRQEDLPRPILSAPLPPRPEASDLPDDFWEFYLALNELDYFEILRVDRDASAEQIKGSYHLVSSVLHPDLHRSKSAEDRSVIEVTYRRTTEAYAILKEEPSRLRYSELLETNRQAYLRFPNDAFPKGRPTSQAEMHFEQAKSAIQRGNLKVAERLLGICLRLEQQNQTYRTVHQQVIDQLRRQQPGGG